MKTLATFTCLFMLFNLGTSLNCYKCEKCIEDKPDMWEKISCGVYGIPIPQPYAWACLTIDFKNKTTSQEEQVRKCVLAEKINQNLLFNCPLDIGEIRSCKICQKDFCT